jgi:Ni,Fe-hydrogenase III small subunit
VIAVGECGANGGELGVSYASCGAVSNVIPVDATIRGCPPTPLDLMRGILEVIGKLPARK